MMLTVDSIHSVNDWLAVLAWTFVVMGLARAIFYSKFAEWLWSASVLGRWNFEYDYEQARWQIAHGVERVRVGTDARGQALLQDRKLKRSEIKKKKAFVKSKRCVVKLLRFVRVPFYCDFCATAQVAFVLLCFLGQGQRLVISTFMYASCGAFVGAMVMPKTKAAAKVMPKTKAAAKDQAEPGCPSGDCRGKRAQVSVTPSKLNAKDKPAGIPASN